MKKILSLLTLFVFLCCGVTVKADELTVADGTKTNNYMPICGFYADQTFKNQFIYPASLLDEMSGGTIESVDFHLNSATITFSGNPQVEVKIAEVEATTLSAFLDATFTTVYTGGFDVANNVLTITFSEGYAWKGGNLLFQFQETQKSTNYPYTYFYGIESTGNGFANYGNYNYGGLQNFLPKATFTYEPASTGGCAKPKKVKATATPDGAIVTWEKGGEETAYQYAVGATDFVVEAWKDVVLAGTDLTFTISDKEAGNYDVCLRSKCGDSEFSDSVRVSFSPVCEAPTNVHTTAISTNTATIAWDAVTGISKYQYLCVAKDADTTGHWAAVAEQEGTSATLPSSLESLTSYDFYVRSWFSKTMQSTATKCTFTTAKALPLTEGFESASLPTGWDNSSYSTYYAWNVYGYNSGHGSTYSARLNAYGGTSYYSDLKTPAIVLSDEAVLYFWHNGANVTAEVYINDGTKETKLADITKVSNWKRDTIDLSDYSSRTVTIIFRGYGVGSSSKYLYIDDVEISVKPCATPTNLAAAASKGSATITWTDDAASEWNLRYKKTADAEWTNVNGLTVKSHTLESLDEEAEYEVQVQAVCSTTRSSEWTASETFTPACPTPKDLILSEKTYNSVKVSWAAGGAETAWLVSWTDNPALGAVGPYVCTETNYLINGLTTGQTYEIYVQASCAGDTAIINYTPAYTEPVVAEAASITDASATVTWGAVSDAEGYEVALTLRGEAVSEWKATTKTDTTFSGLAAATEYDVFVRAKYDTGKSTADSIGFATITIAPRDLHTAAETTSSITISWSNDGAATQYQWKSSKEGSDWTLTSDTFAIESGLESGTSYTFYVRSYYNASVQSDAISAAFPTACDTKALGWSEDFNKSTSIPNCWEADAQWTVVASSGVSSSNGLRFNSNASANVALPATLLSEEAVLRFSHNNYSVSGEIYVNSVAEENKLATIGTTNYSTWKSEEISLADYTNQTVTIIFHGNQYANYSYLNIDNVSVIAKPCPVISNLSATAALDSVVLTWTSEATEFEYCVVPQGNEATGWQDTTATTVTVKGLTPTVAYTAYVRSSCSDTKKGEAKSANFTPACPNPTVLTVDEVTTTTATLSWTAAAGIAKYQWTLVKDEWDDKNVVETTSVELKNLDPATSYTLYVRSWYNADAQSASISKTFATACDVQPLTFNEDFESDLTCWTLVNGASSYSGTTGRNTAAKHTGDNGFAFFYTSNPPQYLITPELETSDKQVQVEFYYKNNEYYGTPYTETFQVGYSTTTNATDAFTFDVEESASDNEWHLYSAILPSGTKYVAIKCTSNNQYRLDIDDFSVAEYIPTAIDFVGTGADGEKVIKLIENDQLVIIRDGIKYNTQGKRLGE